MFDIRMATKLLRLVSDKKKAEQGHGGKFLLFDYICLITYNYRLYVVCEAGNKLVSWCHLWDKLVIFPKKGQSKFT